jgi:hypothetical protein
MVRRLFFLFNIIAVMTLLMQGGYSQSGQAASPISAKGTFLIIWGMEIKDPEVPGSHIFFQWIRTILFS